MAELDADRGDVPLAVGEEALPNREPPAAPLAVAAFPALEGPLQGPCAYGAHPAPPRHSVPAGQWRAHVEFQRRASAAVPPPPGPPRRRCGPAAGGHCRRGQLARRRMWCGSNAVGPALRAGALGGARCVGLHVGQHDPLPRGHMSGDTIMILVYSSVGPRTRTGAGLDEAQASHASVPGRVACSARHRDCRVVAP